MPTTSCWWPSGNGPVSGVPRTSWLAGTAIADSWPGRARSGSIIFIFSRNRNTRDSSLKSVLPRVVRRTRALLHEREEAQQRVHDARVELGAGVAAQLRDRVVQRQRAPVRASEVMACSASQARMIREPSGIASPARPSG